MHSQNAGAPAIPVVGSSVISRVCERSDSLINDDVSMSRGSGLACGLCATSASISSVSIASLVPDGRGYAQSERGCSSDSRCGIDCDFVCL